MAELDVKPKSSSGTPWWVWLLVALAIAALLYFLLRDKDEEIERDDVYEEVETETGTTSWVNPADAPAAEWPVDNQRQLPLLA